MLSNEYGARQISETVEAQNKAIEKYSDEEKNVFLFIGEYLRIATKRTQANVRHTPKNPSGNKFATVITIRTYL